MLWGPYLLLTLAPLNEPTDLAKAIEYQYQQKVSELEAKNQKLSDENRKLKKELYERNSEIQEPKELIASEKISQKFNKDAAHKAYREALEVVESEKWNEAIISMESFVREFPKSEFADHALYWIAQIYLQKGENELARAELQRLITLYPKGTRAKRAKARLLALPDPKVQVTHPELKATAESAKKENPSENH